MGALALARSATQGLGGGEGERQMEQALEDSEESTAFEDLNLLKCNRTLGKGLANIYRIEKNDDNTPHR